MKENPILLDYPSPKIGGSSHFTADLSPGEVHRARAKINLSRTREKTDSVTRRQHELIEKQQKPEEQSRDLILPSTPREDKQTNNTYFVEFPDEQEELKDRSFFRMTKYWESKLVKKFNSSVSLKRGRIVDGEVCWDDAPVDCNNKRLCIEGGSILPLEDNPRRTTMTEEAGLTMPPPPQ